MYAGAENSSTQPQKNFHKLYFIWKTFPIWPRQIDKNRLRIWIALNLFNIFHNLPEWLVINVWIYRLNRNDYWFENSSLIINQISFFKNCFLKVFLIGSEGFKGHPSVNHSSNSDNSTSKPSMFGCFATPIMNISHVMDLLVCVPCHIRKNPTHLSSPLDECYRIAQRARESSVVTNFFSKPTLHQSISSDISHSCHFIAISYRHVRLLFRKIKHFIYNGNDTHGHGQWCFRCIRSQFIKWMEKKAQVQTPQLEVSNHFYRTKAVHSTSFTC